MEVVTNHHRAIPFKRGGTGTPGRQSGRETDLVGRKTVSSKGFRPWHGDVEVACPRMGMGMGNWATSLWRGPCFRSRGEARSEAFFPPVFEYTVHQHALHDKFISKEK